MLHLHFSNHYEVLSQQLLERLDSRTGRAFDVDHVIVPSAAVRRAVTLAIADAQGICSNVAFSYLAPWLWRQTGRLLPDLAAPAPCSPEALTWRVHAVLADEAFLSDHPRLLSYLGGSDELLRYELATRVAALLDQYQTHRPDWLDAWGEGRPADLGGLPEAAQAHARWQAALWRRLRGMADSEDAASALTVLQALDRVEATRAMAAGLPPQVHVLALPTMPALHIAWLQRLAGLTELHLYAINPCREYWFELVEARRLSHLALHGRAEHQEVGHRLLAAWGRQTQSQIDALVASAGDACSDDSDFRLNPGDTLLGRLQNSILELSDPAPGSMPVAPDDRSLEVHVCHSLTRELEVLQDRLLGLFASGVLRHPGEVLVVTPDLDAAAPLIDAVFGTAPADRRLPYTVTGRARSQVNSCARTMLALLSLAGSRFQASEVFGLLQQDLVARRFGLSADALQQVHDWLQASGVRWGLDAAHRAGFGVPPSVDHTWTDALERLVLGYASPDRVAEPFAQRLPAGEVEGSDALALGALWHFVDRLRALQAGTADAQSAPAWRERLVAVVDEFLVPVGDELDDRKELLAAVHALVDDMLQGAPADAATPMLSLPVVRTALARWLDEPARGGVPTGGITFSSMSSLRGLPFRVVCGIGLNDGVFPSSVRAGEFDLMAMRPRRGDRQQRLDERNLFLDLLLSARHTLHLSHTGRSVRDNAALPPSVLIADLLDLLVPAISEDPASPPSLARARAHLVVEHALQPFSPQAFQDDADLRLRSFNLELCEALSRGLQHPASDAQQLAPVQDPGLAEGADRDGEDGADGEADGIDEALDAVAGQHALPAFFTRALSAPDAPWREVSLDDLVRFFHHPCRTLLTRRLGLDLGRTKQALQDDEPFLPDAAGRRAFAERLLEPLMAGESPQLIRRLAEAAQELPCGALGRQQREREIESLNSFAQAVRSHTRAPCLAPHGLRLSFDIDGESWQLGGELADLRPEGLVRWRYDELRARDVLAAWISHLVLCAAPAAGARPQTVWLSQGAALTLPEVGQPLALLDELMRLYRRGLCEPLAFFPKSAWAFMDSGGSRDAARRAWEPTRERPFAEGADPAYRLALRGRSEVLDTEFEALAQQVYGPVIACRDGSAAADGARS